MMPITRTPSPVAAFDRIREAVADIAGGQINLLGGGSVETMTEPLPLYTIDPDSLGRRPRASRVMATMTLTGWRSIIPSEQGHRAADVKVRDDEVRFARMIAGPRVDELIKAAKMAEDDFGGDDYELRIFESSRLKVGAIWLAATPSLFIPFAGLPQRVFNEWEFVRALAERAPAAPMTLGLKNVIAVGSVTAAVLAAGVAVLSRRSRATSAARAESGTDEEESIVTD